MGLEIPLIILGISTGILSGFFGIGGGTVSVPILLYMGFDIKEAIGISAMQMLFSSFAAYLIHRKKQTYSAKITKYFGFGGIFYFKSGACKRGNNF
ncbi:MAG: sulfite exporter TauE/SafE family protein [Sulfurovaceae bacterium]